MQSLPRILLHNFENALHWTRGEGIKEIVEDAVEKIATTLKQWSDGCMSWAEVFHVILGNSQTKQVVLMHIFQITGRTSTLLSKYLWKPSSVPLDRGAKFVI